MIDILQKAAKGSPNKKLIFYRDDASCRMTYSQLYERAMAWAEKTRYHLRGAPTRTVLLHLDSQHDYVIAFWAVLAAGGVPVVSTPLSADPVVRTSHWHHLHHVLKKPLVITTMKFFEHFIPHEYQFRGILLANWDLKPHYLDLKAVDGLEAVANTWTNRDGKLSTTEIDLEPNNANSVAFMMLTSGSTGKSKAVEITHGQVLASMNGKSRMLDTSEDDAFLNWVGFDHVACLTEIHLHAMYVGASQVHMAPSIATQDPLKWIDLLSTHSISITFAPNFFLASTLDALRRYDSEQSTDLSRLRFVVSGGETNKIPTATAFNDAVRKLGAKRDVVCPAFGMTETCAGSFYNKEFPRTELQNQLEFCSVGKAIDSMQWRITTDAGTDAKVHEAGNLQLRGPLIVKRYHNDHENTDMLISSDGWFDTGDVGHRDPESNLILVGRTKDIINLRGVKYFSQEIVNIVEVTGCGFVKPSYAAAFPIFTKMSFTEDFVIVFVAEKDMSDEELFNTIVKINKAVFVYCSCKPYTIIPLPANLLEKSSLGKFSRSYMETAYHRGKFADHETETLNRLSSYRQSISKAPTTDMERRLAKEFASEFRLDLEDVSITDSLIDMGVDSIRLLRFKVRLQQRLGLGREIPIGTLLTSPTIEALAWALDDNASAVHGAYDPVVILQTGKSQSPPIWFIHPGLGEVLVFLNISRYFSDRQVYALRAPGFNAGEKKFDSIDEMTNVYMDAIRQQQPDGPYILIGYSFGSMIAFETTKKLEAAGQEVYMSSLNGPPHIKWRMVQIDWCELFLNLSYFLGLLAEEEAVKRSAEFHDAGYTRDDILRRIVTPAIKWKLDRLDLDATKLARWADVSANLQGLAHTYDPTGKVKHIDVFYAQPLLAVGKDKEVWRRDHLEPWNDFCEEPAKFHDSPGAHYTMLDQEHVLKMQKILKGALGARGVE
ncbi:putative NRPS-like protein biosynthetic cluster [Pestalotiopsis sp. 9143b]|nr:putative NRPS-like protein biosynthetic cluster [Pestalotiopsis sp. 9143b]